MKEMINKSYYRKLSQGQWCKAKEKRKIYPFEYRVPKNSKER